MPNPTKAEIKTALEKKPDAVLEFISRDLGIPLSHVIDCLPPAEVTRIPATGFAAMMSELATLGQITLILHTEDIVLECKGQIPEGSFGRGYYNIHGESPIGGHIKAENCGAIYLLSREMMGRPSHVAIFCNHQGEAMFKVYLGRDEKRNLIPKQVSKFQEIRENFSQPEAAGTA